MPLALVLTTLAALSGILHVGAEYRGPRRRVYLFKPLTVVLILVLALTVAEPVSARYQAAVVVGLACSLAGDVFLMLPRDRFLPGIACFLLAHLAYLVAFTTDAAFCGPAADRVVGGRAGYVTGRHEAVPWPGARKVPDRKISRSITARESGRRDLTGNAASRRRAAAAKTAGQTRRLHAVRPTPQPHR